MKKAFIIKMLYVAWAPCTVGLVPDLTVTFARVCSQVWVTYQIMTTVAWNVQVEWPEVSDACARLVVCVRAWLCIII